MCGNGTEIKYKEHFACFDCRKMFKQTNRNELPESKRPKPGEPRICKCPQCAKPMADLGRYFRPPPSRAKKQWEAVFALYGAGITFHACACCGPGYRPEELREVWSFIEGGKNKQEAEVLITTLKARVKARRAEERQRKG